MGRIAWLLALVLVPAALAAADPGVRPDSILIGGTAPLSAGSRGAAAYFASVNRRGGVNGRRIVYRLVDAGDDPLAAAQQLVEEDGVLALFNTPGTEDNLAMREYLNGARVPQLYVASGAAAWGYGTRRYPWTIGFRPSHELEGSVLARAVLRSKPKAAIAVLYEDDADGRELLAAFRRGLGPRAGQIVAAGDATALGGVKANVLVALSPGRRPGGSWSQLYLGIDAARGPAPAGAVAIAYVKDPHDPQWARDPQLTGDAGYAARMAAAFTLVDVLRRAGQDPTRAKVLAAARSLTEAGNPFLVPGIVVRTGARDGFPVEQVALQRRAGGRWHVFTGPVS